MRKPKSHGCDTKDGRKIERAFELNYFYLTKLPREEKSNYGPIKLIAGGGTKLCLSFQLENFHRKSIFQFIMLLALLFFPLNRSRLELQRLKKENFLKRK